ncbi:protein of unknown function [Methylocella tundrae]|uniref:Uncharacterized protein n=1 Tax=Methylocella tundrae TaxID=227605 RepID=A0A4U8YXJ3_METTU|nr:protein of unknown function [Methylocella tundrae]
MVSFNAWPHPKSLQLFGAMVSFNAWPYPKSLQLFGAMLYAAASWRRT